MEGYKVGWEGEGPKAEKGTVPRGDKQRGREGIFPTRGDLAGEDKAVEDLASKDKAGGEALSPG